MLEFSDKDILRGKVVSPDWYLVSIDDFEEKLSKDGQSTNFNYEGTIIKNASNGDTEFANVPIRWNFNSKAKGFMIGFLAVFGVTVEKGKRYDLSAFIGKQLDIFVENEIYESRMINKINHKYRAVRND
jgi:hypothetical protein